jgi:methylase of polypeptide subunit release factors
LQERCTNKGDLEELHQSAVASTMEAAFSALYCVKGLISHSHIEESSQKLVRLLEKKESDYEAISSQIGSMLEQLRGRRLSVDKKGYLTIETSAEQRKKGVYFTPPSLANSMVRSSLKSLLDAIGTINELRKVSILDPAVGGGAFLLSALRVAVDILSKKPQFIDIDISILRQEIVNNCLYGVDVDPVAIATTHALLIAEVGVLDWQPENLDKHLHVADAVAASIDDWRKWFPECSSGFDVIVTNPPWSKLRPLRREFFKHIDKSVKNLQGSALGDFLKANMSSLLNSSWEEYVGSTIELSKRLRDSDEYVVNQKSYGDPDLYKYFIERSVKLLSKNGTASLLVPSGILRAKGSSALRRLMYGEGQVIEIKEYINSKKIFDIHPMYRFVSILFKNTKKKKGTRAFFGQKEPQELSISSSVNFDSDFLNLVGGEDFLIPELRNQNEKLLIEKLYKDNPPSNCPLTKRVSFRREIDMTNDSENFIDLNVAISKGFKAQSDGRWVSSHSQDILLPLYEGRMVNQYDCRAKEYLSGQGRSAKWDVPTPGAESIRPHFLVPEIFARKKGWEPIERIGYCEISGHAATRTVLAAKIPAYSVCGNKVPILRGTDIGVDDDLLWLAYANSLVVDWIMRRWISTTINQFYWKNIPFPRNLSALDRAFLVDATRLLSADKPPAESDDTRLWLGKRAQLRAAIDAVVVNLYSLSNDELEVLLDNFDLFLKRKKGSSFKSINFIEILDYYRCLHKNGDLTIELIFDGCYADSLLEVYATREQFAIITKEL